jgi:predicted protein tyrosine phosphatase
MLKVLFICTGNIDRSPTAEDLLKGREGFDVRSAGTMAGARRQVDLDDLAWADVIFVMEDHHRESLLKLAPGATEKIRVLGIPDLYYRGDERLVEILKERLEDHGISV